MIRSTDTNNNRNQSKSSSILPSTPVRTSSQPDRQTRLASSKHHQQITAVTAAAVDLNQHQQRPLPTTRRDRNLSDNLDGSRTTNTSTNVSPSFINDNNSRTVLLGSDDIQSPHRQPRSSRNHHHHSNSASGGHSNGTSHHRAVRSIQTDSQAEYDEVASHSTVDDSTPQTTSESTSMSEIPLESRFKTFVKQKKNKNKLSVSENHHHHHNINSSTNDHIEDDHNNNHHHHIAANGHDRQQVVLDSDVDASTRLLSDPQVASSNSYHQRQSSRDPILTTSNNVINNHQRLGSNSQLNGRRAHETSNPAFSNGVDSSNITDSNEDYEEEEEDDDDDDDDENEQRCLTTSANNINNNINDDDANIMTSSDDVHHQNMQYYRRNDETTPSCDSDNHYDSNNLVNGNINTNEHENNIRVNGINGNHDEIVNSNDNCDEDDDDDNVEDDDDDDDEEDEDEADDAEEGVYDLSEGHVTGKQQKT